jgi:DNA-binding transcriptional ArsR family regulator
VDRAEVLAALQALAHATRLDLIRLLVDAGPTGLPAGQIAQALGLAAPRLSFHLAALEQAGLIRSQRVARNVIYRVEAGRIGGTIGYLLHDCCCGCPEVRAACTTDHAPAMAAGQGGGAASGMANT